MTSEENTHSTPGQVEKLDPLIHTPTRLQLMAMLYVVESMDYVFLKNQSGYSWGNLSTHVNKLEEAGYISIKKSFRGRKPNTTLKLTDKGREAFRTYKNTMQEILNDLPE